MRGHLSRSSPVSQQGNGASRETAESDASHLKGVVDAQKQEQEWNYPRLDFHFPHFRLTLILILIPVRVLAQMMMVDNIESLFYNHIHCIFCC